MQKSLLALAIAALALVGAVLVWSSLDPGSDREPAAPTAVAAAAPAEQAAPQRPAAQPLAQALAPTGPAAAANEREALAPAPEKPTEPDWKQGPLQWVEGRVAVDQRLPADEELFVFATRSEHLAARLYDNDRPGGRAWREDPRLDGELVSRVRADADGRFRLELPGNLERTHLALAGRYLFSRATTAVELPANEPVVLEGELGSWITGRLVPPAGSAPELAGIAVELGPDLTAGFDAFAIQHSAWEHEDETDAEGRFEFRGVTDVIGHGLIVKPEDFAAVLQLGIRTEPGRHETLEIALDGGATLRGRVLDEAGQPKAGVRVAATLPGVIGQAIGDVRETTSDDQGAFTLAHVASGKLEVEATLDGYRRATFKLDRPLAEGQERDGIELVLERGRTIAGRVTYPDGLAAAGVKVSAVPDYSQAGGLGMTVRNARSGSAETDEEGRFSMTGLADSAYDLVARQVLEEGDHAGTWKALASLDGEATEVDLVLEGLTPVLGRVVDAEGVAIARYTITARHSASGQAALMAAFDQRRTEVDDEEGRFRLEDLESGTWDLRVRAEGYATGTLDGLELPRPAGSEELVIALVPDATVTGLVLGTGGEPVSGAQVSVEVDLMTRMRSMAGSELPRTFSDGEGRFRLALDPGEHSLVASLDGYAPSAPVSCELATGELLEDVVLTLRLGGTLRGIVLDDEGEGDAGRMVIVQKTPSYSAQKMLTSDADGRFEVEHLEPGKWQVVATKNFMAGELDESDGEEMTNDFLSSMKMDMVDIVDGELTEVVLGGSLGSPVKVRGRVLHGGQPVGTGIVSAIPEDGNGLKDMKMKSLGSDGTFEMTLPKAGNFLVTVQMNASIGQQQNTELLETIPEGVEEYELVIELPLGRIAGRVKGEDGKPLAKCRVTLNAEGASYGSSLGGHYAEASTDDEGYYELEYLGPGTYTVAAGGLGFGGLFGGQADAGRVVRGGLRIHEGQSLDHVDFRLEKPGDLTGTVLNLAGAPVQDAVVFVRDENGLPLEAFSLVGTDGAGRFSYRGLAPGRYTVSARTQSGATPESAPVRVASGETADVRLVLGGGTILVVTVIDSEGNELGTRLSVIDGAGREYGSMRSLSEIMERFGATFDGKEQRIGPVPPGTYEILATTDDGREVSKKVTLTDQEERRIKLRLK